MKLPTTDWSRIQDDLDSILYVLEYRINNELDTDESIRQINSCKNLPKFVKTASVNLIKELGNLFQALDDDYLNKKRH